MRAAGTGVVVGLAGLLALGCSPGDEVKVRAPLLAGCAPGGAAACYLHLEAEDFAGAWAEQRNLRGFYGRGFATSNRRARTEEPAVAKVDLPAGRYHVFTRALADAESDRRWRVEIGTSTLADTHGARMDDGDAAYEWAAAGVVRAPGGVVEVRLVDRGDGFETPDAIVITDDPALDPRRAEPELLAFAPGEARASAVDEVIQRAETYAAEVEIPTDPVEWLSRRDALRPRVAAALGLDREGPKSPLNAEIVGRIAHEGYTMERLRFESRPGLVVTAHVFVPDGPGPFPAMISPIGHYYDFGKMDHRSAARAHGLALQGVLTLHYDAFGQGERDISGHPHGVHWKLGLTGRTNMTIMVWDSIRALDYLLTRDDVDPARVGITGASGGGLNAVATSVVEPRLAMSAPAVYLTQIDDLIGSRIMHGECARLPELGGFTNMGEVAGLFAPKPQLAMAAERDNFFPIDGARAAGAQLEQVYAVAGAEDQARFEVFETNHIYAEAMRERLYGFVDYHFFEGESDARLPEPALSMPARDDPEYFVVEGGKISGDTVSPEDLALGWAEAAIATLPRPDALDPDALREVLQAKLRGRVLPFAPEVVVGPGPSNPAGLELETWRIEVAPGVELPAFVHRGPPGAPVVVFVDGGDRTSSANLAAAAAEGVSAVQVNLRGWGELQEDELTLLGDNLMLGDSLLGQRASDLGAVRAALREDPALSDAPTLLMATGVAAGVVGLYAQALDAPFDAAVIGVTPSSYVEVFDGGVPAMAMVFGILDHADFPHLARLAAARPLAWATKWGAMQERDPEWAADLATRLTRLERISLGEALSTGLRLLDQ